MPVPRLRDSSRLITHELYPLGLIPDDIIRRISQYIVYLLATGRKDMTGDEWGDGFAYAIGGTHLASPLGIADVVYGNQAWTCKTVKNPNPFTAQNIRLISGRNNVNYSYGITDAFADIQDTGQKVLEIWNGRVQIAMDNFNPVRTIVLVRSNDMKEFTIFEEQCVMHPANQFHWVQNQNDNFIGQLGNETRFTWQPDGSQFTIHTKVPDSAIKFRVKKPSSINIKDMLELVGFDDSWVDII